MNKDKTKMADEKMVNEPTQPRITTICIDIGMTASGAIWRHHEAGCGWKTMFGGDKVPTKLAYDTRNGQGTSVIWGKSCEDLPPHTKVHECFKASVDEKYSPDTKSGLPRFSKLEVRRWMTDYIQSICQEVVNDIDATDYHATVHWKDGTIHWIFTVPGSWAQFPTVADFKEYAQDAVFRCIGNKKGSKVITDITEARAAAQYLLKYGSANSIDGYIPGNTVLSCDIGGATTDIAVSQIEAPGLLITPKQWDLHPAGMLNIDTRFRLHVQKALDDAGIPNSMEVAEAISGEPFRKVKRTFTDRQTGNWIVIPLEEAWNARNSSPPGNESGTGTKIQDGDVGKELRIHKDTMTNLFANFVKGIDDTIDSAINSLKQDPMNETHLNAIGLCGGGAHAAHLVQHLRRRYDKIHLIDPTTYHFTPDLATLIGCGMLYEQQKVKGFCDQMRFGMKWKDKTVWGELREVQTQLNFDTAYTMEVGFIKTTHSLLSSVKCVLVAVPKSAPASKLFSEAIQIPGSRSWTVKIDLTHVDTRDMSLRKTYEVIYKISGEWEIQIVAETGLPARRIQCELI